MSRNRNLRNRSGVKIYEVEAVSNIGEAEAEANLEFTMRERNLRNGLLLFSLEAKMIKMKSVQRAF